uniref:Uncharacterized protein n=1 Tax=Rhizophora mucronata TaxID=61149 RepID=A0A2P2NF69_RHIMU
MGLLIMPQPRNCTSRLGMEKADFVY